MGKDEKKKRDRRGSSSERDDRDDKKSRKLNETREEKMARRLHKKALKRQKEEQSKTICGYTDDNNRFGDSNLTSTFRWHKKDEMLKEKSGGKFKTVDEMGAREKRRAEEARKREIEEEVEKVKRRREEREKEQAWLEEEKARMSRETEELQHCEWEKKADDFHLEQAQLRSKIRIREGRAKPIDVLAKNLSSEDMDVEITEPYKLFKGLAVPALEELEKDIALHQSLDSENKAFWEAMVVVCADELQQARRQEAWSLEGKPGLLVEEGVHAAIQEDVVKMLSGKSVQELDEQEQEIRATLEGDEVADNEFWEAVLKRLVVARAKSQLKEIHGNILRRRLESLETAMLQESREAEAALEEEAAKEEEEAEAEEQSASEDDDEGNFSPVLDSGYGGDDAVDEAEDKKNIEEARKAVLDSEADKFKQVTAQAAVAPAQGGTDTLFLSESNKPLGPDEAVFNTEVSLDQQVYSWHDKYRPRKPRFFNRVHTGYEWNKYNQTHYDHDNPPPKIVQGYKFNIFYPDLIDKTKAPTFRLENDSNPETKILRFTAGPPYEDLAFRVVNKEW
eukprot:CAMPEP_0181305188 /NCGR_PEP_ID=MMETSP1101-20121128/9582_1 /TAXON_ID=46948 /ORGANISM="Rhodomonas abbreviata, Strain Caron Lab Isolate" /LENGTH=563 /DNA_ID=CAMNT_0023411059 /DNA_START=181 /DNA_END=1869 /DNA_ORIENTATION=-